MSGELVQQLARGHVPNVGIRAGIRGDEFLAVGREGQHLSARPRSGEFRVTIEIVQQRACVTIAKLDFSGHAARDKFPIGGDRQRHRSL